MLHFFILLMQLVAATHPLQSLVFEGGGVRGTVYAGAVVALEEAGALSHIHSFAGTSAGSSAAAMLAVGYTACEFSNEVMVQSFADLVEFSLFNRLKLAFLGSGTSALANLLRHQKGFFSGRSLEDAADIAIAKKLCSIDLNMSFSSITQDDLKEERDATAMEGKCAMYRRATFGFLNDLNHGSKKLSISSFDITNGTLVYFNVGTAADMAISKAIRMSSSIPLIFEPVEYKGHLFVDGALMRRLPIDAFPSNASMVALKINQDFIPTTPTALEHMSVSSFAYRLIRAMAKQTQDLDIVQKAKQNGVHFVDFSSHSFVSTVSPIEFDLSQSKKVAMFTAGYTIMRKYLESNTVQVDQSTAKASCQDNNTLSCAFPFCVDADNCEWLRNMKMNAIQQDQDQRSQIYNSWLSLSMLTFGVDPIVFVQLGVLVLICAVCSQCMTQSRNGIHKMLVENYSGIRTLRCEHCLRPWMPADLPAHTIPTLPREEIEKALSVRGIYLAEQTNGGAGGLRQISSDSQQQLPMKISTTDANVDRSLRLRLHKAVWWENISLRRPWSWLSHSQHAPIVGQRCGHDCPISFKMTFIVLVVWLSYLVSVLASA